MDVKSQPFITKTERERTELFDNMFAELGSRNFLDNEKFSVQVNKVWPGILLPMLYKYLDVCNDYAIDSSTPKKNNFI